MKSVALVGFAPNTLGKVGASQADEIWSVVWAYNYTQIPRIDRLFEMHPIHVAGASTKPEYVKVRSHLAWLRANDRIPVYMTERYADIPMSVRYPIEQAAALTANWKRGEDEQYIFTSSLDYMWALAILEGFERVELYGVELSSGSEYAYQREGYAVWHGFALGRGIEVIQHKPSLLLHKPKRYGYDGFQMIYRQDLERLRRHYEEQHEAHEARVQYYEGQFAVIQKALDEYNGGDQATIDYLTDQRGVIVSELQKYRDLLAVASGALQTVDYLIREIDLEENDATLYNPFESVIVGSDDSVRAPG